MPQIWFNSTQLPQDTSHGTYRWSRLLPPVIHRFDALEIRPRHKHYAKTWNTIYNTLCRRYFKNIYSTKVHLFNQPQLRDWDLQYMTSYACMYSRTNTFSTLLYQVDAKGGVDKNGILLIDQTKVPQKPKVQASLIRGISFRVDQYTGISKLHHSIWEKKANHHSPAKSSGP